MFNLNFASNENWSGAKEAWRIMRQPKIWQQGVAIGQLKTVMAQDFQVPNQQVFFSLAARSSLRLFLESLHLPTESEILVQAFTCEAVVLPIIASKLQPIYVDIEPKTWSMSLTDLKKKTSEKSRVLILQHTFGMLPLERQDILAWAKTKNILVIEDLAHGFAPELLAEPGDSTKLLSFGRSKFFSSVNGGALVISDQALAEELASNFSQLAPTSRLMIKKALLYKILAPLISQTYAWGGKLLHGLVNRLGIFGREISQRERFGDYDPWLDRQLPNALAIFCLAIGHCCAIRCF